MPKFLDILILERIAKLSQQTEALEAAVGVLIEKNTEVLAVVAAAVGSVGTENNGDTEKIELVTQQINQISADLGKAVTELKEAVERKAPVGQEPATKASETPEALDNPPPQSGP